MRIIKISTLTKFGKAFPQAKEWLKEWRKHVQEAKWKNLTALRVTYPSADGVRVKSGRIVIVFNVCGNKYRFVASFHYNRLLTFVHRLMTHAEYSKNNWKNDL